MEYHVKSECAVNSSGDLPVSERKMLNEMAKQGWKLVAVSVSTNGQSVLERFFYFERPRRSNSE